MQSITEKILFLKQVPIFRGMTFEQLGMLGTRLEEYRFQAGEVIFREGEPGAQLHLIVSGRVHILKHYRGAHERRLAVLTARDFFGEMGIFEHALHAATAVAETDTEVLLLRADNFQQAIAQNPAMAFEIGRELSARLRRTTEARLKEAAPSTGIPCHILVPVDFTAYAEHVCEYAVALATAVQARVTLLHVIEPPGLVRWGENPEMEATITAYLDQRQTEMRRAIEGMAQRVREAGVRCDTVVISGSPFQGIGDVARMRQVDLIVMGSHGRRGLQRFFLGDVAESVVQLAPCSVLVVRGKSEPSSP